MNVVSSSLTLFNNTLLSNSAKRGGALYINGFVNITKCRYNFLSLPSLLSLLSSFPLSSPLILSSLFLTFYYFLLVDSKITRRPSLEEGYFFCLLLDSPKLNYLLSLIIVGLSTWRVITSLLKRLTLFLIMPLFWVVPFALLLLLLLLISVTFILVMLRMAVEYTITSPLVSYHNIIIIIVLIMSF